MKKIILAAGSVLLVLIITSCQQIFTYSLFEDLGWQRDVSNLSATQKVAYAKSALASGDADAMGEAYEAVAALLADTTAEEDPELYTLAAELAIGAVNLAETLTDALVAYSSADDSAMTDLLDFEDEDIALLGSAVDAIEALEAAEQDVSEDLYVNGAVALFIIAVEEADGIDNLDYENPSTELSQALEWANEGAVDLESYFGG